ncbi:MAG: ATP-grasp domain-containing protein [Planctomycetota bacterium]|nr:MAG: ATP-grasp domain-containing protein [Planctomycetota bacterium]
MLAALVGDLLKLGGVTVATTWDRRLSPSEFGLEWHAAHPKTRLERHEVSGPTEEAELFATLSQECDATLIIAPELEGELLRRRSLVPPARSLNSTPLAIDQCGDKWVTYQHLMAETIPTIPTELITEGPSIGPDLVIKQRFGAGSQEIWRVSSVAAWRDQIPSERQSRFVVQPYIAGTHHSIGVLIDRSGRVHILPVADQRIAVSQGFAYEGGKLPTATLTDCQQAEARKRAEQVVAAFPGLQGYFGIDLLCPQDCPDTMLVVEINPRLTTSYVGYRALCRTNLAAVWLGSDSTIDWHSGRIAFTPEGSWQWDR